MSICPICKVNHTGKNKFGLCDTHEEDLRGTVNLVVVKSDEEGKCSIIPSEENMETTGEVLQMTTELYGEIFPEDKDIEEPIVFISERVFAQLKGLLGNEEQIIH